MLASLGYRGGLKAVERNLGLRRDPAIQGVDGFEAVQLWRRYRQGDRAALRKLMLYNLTDVVNLVELVRIAVTHKARQAAFPGNMQVGGSSARAKPDAESVRAWIARRWRMLNGQC